ncbi:DUF1461 domain-containing protein [Candidatus Woesearchaeota archaeon]|nr:DUF1461 domain-containing protein [Candidatus Woesearchaeota archaeon]
MKSLKIALIILVLSICALLLFSNTKSNIFNEEYYHQEFEKLGVYDKINKSTADSAVTNLHEYFKNKAELDEFWDESEKSHMHDVKELIRRGVYLYYGLIIMIIILLYLIYLLKPEEYFFNISIAFIMAGAAIGASQIITYSLSKNFESIFIKFHEIFFPQGNWMFGSGNMIQLFPEQFFMDMSIKILHDTLMSGLLLLILGIAGIIYHRTKKSQEQSHPSKDAVKSPGKHQ